MEWIRNAAGLIGAWLTAAQGIPALARSVFSTHDFSALFWLALVVFLLRKIKIRRPRRFAEEDTLTDEASDDTQEEEAADTDGTEALSREEEKGRRGEDLIEEILYQTVPGEFALFRNVYIPSGSATCEADLVMVHETGIFVFESKNYSGWIFGTMSGLHWVQRFPNGEKHSFYNPVRQNRNHIKALSEYLNLSENLFYSYVVFSDRCALRKVSESTRATVITQTSRLRESLHQTFSHAPIVYRHEEIQAISGRLFPLTQVDAEVKTKHIENIRAALESETCPFCGGKLVIRRGKYGTFWGCSSYPNCKFTRNVT